MEDNVETEEILEAVGENRKLTEGIMKTERNKSDHILRGDRLLLKGPCTQ